MLATINLNCGGSAMKHRLYLRGDVWWYDIHREDGTRERKSTKKHDRTAAEHVVNARIRTLTHGPGWTLEEAADWTRQNVWRDTPGETTAWTNTSFALRYFGAATPVEAITTLRMADYTNWLREEHRNSESTIDRKLSALGRILRSAVQTGHLAVVPYLQRPRRTQGRKRFLSDAEEASILHLFEQWGDTLGRCGTVILVDTGLRVSELHRLQWRDVDFSSKQLTVWQTKSKSPRTVPMTQRVMDALTTLLKRAQAERDDDDPVLPTDRALPGFTKWTYLGRWNRVKSALNLEDDRQFVPHCLRHTCASRLVQRGVSLPVIQAWLGHKTIQTTMVYAHLSPTQLHDAARVLEPAAAVTAIRRTT